MPSHVLLQPYQPSDADPFDAVKAAHLLNRAGFGGTPVEVEKVRQLGPAAAVDWLLDFKDENAEQQGHDLPDLSSMDGYPKTYRELQRQFAGKDEAEKRELRMKVMGANREALRATVAWWLRRMAYGPHALQEKLTLFWHGHFVTSDKDEREASLMWNQNELLRKQAAGNFRTFVRAVSRDAAMLDYLNNNQNKKAHPNENYAREVMELFTLGIGTYTEQDVKEAARAFTGWAHDGDDFIYRKNEHDTGVKNFLGRTGTFDGDDILDIALAQPVCAKFVGTKLFRFFAYEEVDDHLSDAIGGELRSNNYELRPLLRTILTSRAFYSGQAVGSQIKSPVQLVMGTIRQMNLEMPPDRGILNALNQMGQLPFAPPNVRGWPGGRMWINTSTLFVRYNTATKLLDGRLPRLDGSGLIDDGSPTEAAAVVDHWVARLIQRPIADDKRQVLLAAVGPGPVREDGVRKMLQLIVAMPEYQLC